MNLLPVLALAVILPTQGTPLTALPERARAIELESQQAARLMLGSPDLLAVYRNRFEAAVAKELEHPSSGTKEDIEPDLRAQLAKAAGEEYVGELRAGLERGVTATGLSFAAHMEKYELDQFVAFLATSGGRKFMAFIYRNALAIRDGAVSEEQAGEDLTKLLKLTELQDLQSAMTSTLLEHWKAAATEMRPAISAWAEGASTRTAAKMGDISAGITREYLRSKEPAK